MYFDFKNDLPFSEPQVQNEKLPRLMRQSKLKLRANQQFQLAENAIGGRFLNHSTVFSSVSKGNYFA